MQAVTSSFRAVSLRQSRRSLLPQQIASTSRAPVQLMQKRGAWSPMEWFQRTLTPQIREKDSESEIQQARERAREAGEASVFDYDVPGVAKVDGKEVTIDPSRPRPDEHRGATSNFKISHRKLNKLGRQISGKPIDTAIMQMNFSEKRASQRIKSMLAQAKGSAVARGMDPQRLVVSEAWVNKGMGGRMMKRLEIRGRGKMGIRTKYSAKMVVKLREGLTYEEKKVKEREYKLRRIVSSGLNREDVPLRNPAPQWAW